MRFVLSTGKDVNVDINSCRGRKGDILLKFRKINFITTLSFGKWLTMTFSDGFEAGHKVSLSH